MGNQYCSERDMWDELVTLLGPRARVSAPRTRASRPRTAALTAEAPRALLRKCVYWYRALRDHRFGRTIHMHQGTVGIERPPSADWRTDQRGDTLLLTASQAPTVVPIPAQAPTVVPIPAHVSTVALYWLPSETNFAFVAQSDVKRVDARYLSWHVIPKLVSGLPRPLECLGLHYGPLSPAQLLRQDPSM